MSENPRQHHSGCAMTLLSHGHHEAPLATCRKAHQEGTTRKREYITTSKTVVVVDGAWMRTFPARHGLPQGELSSCWSLESHTTTARGAMRSSVLRTSSWSHIVGHQHLHVLVHPYSYHCSCTIIHPSEHPLVACLGPCPVVLIPCRQYVILASLGAV